MLRARLLMIALCLVAVGVAPASADEPKPTVVEGVEATATADGVSVAAAVDWGGTTPQVIGTDPAGDAPPAQNATAGLGLDDLTGMTAWVPDGNEPVVTFSWDLATFDQIPPPELVRYYMTFTLGGQPFALQAKTRDAASGANLTTDPQTAAERLASYAEHVAATGTLPEFRLRGNCETISVVVTGIGNCPHVAWISGEFDTEAMPALRPGAVLTTDQGAWASLQAVSDNATTRDTLAAASQTGLPWQIPQRTATATLRDADGTVVVGPLALAVDGDGAVRGTVGAAGLDAGDYLLEVGACIASTCGTGSAAVSL